jgi:hypothetical protein
MQLVGDVTGGVCIIVDDMIDTAGTLCKAIKKSIKEQQKGEAGAKHEDHSLSLFLCTVMQCCLGPNRPVW